MPEGWVLQAAADFWSAVPGGDQFPRDAARAIPWALPVAVSTVSGLSLAVLQHYLRRIDVPSAAPAASRRLHGCLVARSGHGVVFIDTDVTEAERRFTAAHEAAHFIADHLEPRRSTVQAVGAAGLEILDGRRTPSLTDRFRAAIAGQDLEAYVHLTGRRGGEPEVESRADRLALELLAPEDDVLAALALERDVDAAFLLRTRYGLPPAVAARYALWLTSPATAVPGAWLLRPRSPR